MKAPVILAFAAAIFAICPQMVLAAPEQPEELARSAESDLYLGIVGGLIRQQRYQAAIAFLDRYGASGASSPRYQLLRGEALVGAERYDDAVKAFMLAMKTGTSAEAYNGIGRARAEQQSWSQAAENFRRAADLDPTNAQYLNNLGYAKLQQKLPGDQMASVMGDLQKAHELEPGSVLIRNNLILAAAATANRDQMSALLSGIGNSAERAAVTDFASHWTGGQDSAPKQKVIP